MGTSHSHSQRGGSSRCFRCNVLGGGGGVSIIRQEQGDQATWSACLTVSIPPMSVHRTVGTLGQNNKW